ncbi:MAG: hypothetical protein H0U97_06820 [Gammaproteobacteria bacterium]|nr:hypothetical protein [Gammaproteobacteria bacterium]
MVSAVPRALWTLAPLLHGARENATRFIFDETPLTKDQNGNDVPGDADELKTEGYIYEFGSREWSPPRAGPRFRFAASRLRSLPALW